MPDKKAKKLDAEAQQKLLKTMLDRFAQAFEYDNDNSIEMQDDIKFLYGGRYQWDESDYLQRQTDKRPSLTINKVKPAYRQVSNELRLNKASIKVRPVDDKSDKKTAEVFEGLIRNIEKVSNAQVAYQCAVDGAVKAGYGVFEIRNTYNADDSFEQDIEINRILNQFAVYFDPSAKKITKEDGNYAFVCDNMTEEAFEAKYPNAQKSSFEEGDTGFELWYKDKIRVARYYVKEPVTKELAQYSDGTVSYITKEQKESGMFENGVKIAKSRIVKTHKVMCYVVSGAEVLEPPYEVPSKYIPLVPIYGEETLVDGEVKYSGIVRDAKDPQRLYNYWRTTAAETIALQPKAPWLVTAKMVALHKGHWDKANQSNLPYLPYTYDEQAGSPKKEQPVAPPAAMWQESSIASDDIKFTTGIFDAGLGNQGPEQSGRAIIARQNKSDISNYLYTDNRDIAMQHAGKILIDMIPRVYDTARIVRILNPDDTEDFKPINQKGPDGKMIHDLTVGKYDVSITTGPSFQSQRQEAVSNQLEFINVVPSVGPMIADLVANNLDGPGSEEMAKRIKKTMDPALFDGEVDEEQQAANEDRAQEVAAQKKLQEAAFAEEMRAKAAKTDLDIAKTDTEEAKRQEILAGIDAQERENYLKVVALLQPSKPITPGEDNG